MIGLSVGFIWRLIAGDRPESHAAVSPEENAHIRAGIGKPATAGSKAVPWGSILRSKEVIAMSASYFCFCYVAYLFFSWFFTYLAEVRHQDLKSSAFYGMLPFLGMMTCSPLGGWISDRLTARYGKRAGRCFIAVAALALSGLFLALGTQVASAPMACLVLAGGAGSLYLSQSSYWSVTAGLAGSSAGSVSGVMNMCGQFGGAVTASLTPWIAAHYGWTASFLVAAGFAIGGAVIWLAVEPAREIAVPKLHYTPVAGGRPA